MRIIASLVFALTACIGSMESQTETAVECNEIDLECTEGDGSGGGGGGDDEGGPSCETKDGLVYLDQDPANLDDADGKVTFCHATSSATNKFVVLTTSVNACKAHEAHTKLPKGGVRDVFPTGGCAD